MTSARKISITQLTPPIKSLTPTLQDSLNWSPTPNSGADFSFNVKESTRLSSLISEGESKSSLRYKRQPLSLSNVLNTSSVTETSNDSVFESSGSINISCNTSGEVFHTCMKENCEPEPDCTCASHLKVPSRQQSEMDDTPQMHRYMYISIIDRQSKWFYNQLK